jgi:poly(A) polymerase
MPRPNSLRRSGRNLKGLSRERIGMETMNLLALPDPAPTVARMQALGVLAEILPEADVPSLAALVAQEQAQGIAPSPSAIWPR